MLSKVVLALCSAVCLPAASPEWVNLLEKGLDAWEVRGDGVWTLLRDGTLLGQRDLQAKSEHQSWVYSKQDYGEYDLQLEYWTRLGGNSGISIRDTSRARWACGAEWDRNRTPSHIGYEIQISNGYRDTYPTGSVYLFAKATPGVQIDNDWNHLEIQSRGDMIRVKVNGKPVAQHPGEAGRPKVGPIGLQLHDRQSIAMFRNIRIREIGGKKKP